MENPVRKTTFEVIKFAKDVKINKKRIKEIAKEWIKEKIEIPPWPKEYHLETNDKQKMLDYLIILDAVNVCFWNKKERWAINYKGEKYNGYYAWATALKKFFEENPEKANLEYFSKIKFKDFKNILQNGKNLLFLKKRWQIIKSVSFALIKKYDNSQSFIKSCGKKMSVLVNKIYKELPYFADISIYNKKKIYLLKRAQILGSEIWGAFDGKEIGEFNDLDYLTCFPDYKIPQILHQFGILEYSPNLEIKIRNRNIIPQGSNQEIEIRSCTVWAVEYLKKTLENLGKKFYSFQIDWILWNKAQKIKIRMPYHLTKTIYY